jgi:hypothetical protein
VVLDAEFSDLYVGQRKAIGNHNRWMIAPTTIRAAGGVVSTRGALSMTTSGDVVVWPLFPALAPAGRPR